MQIDMNDTYSDVSSIRDSEISSIKDSMSESEEEFVSEYVTDSESEEQVVEYQVNYISYEDIDVDDESKPALPPKRKRKHKTRSKSLTKSKTNSKTRAKSKSPMKKRKSNRNATPIKPKKKSRMSLPSNATHASKSNQKQKSTPLKSILENPETINNRNIKNNSNRLSFSRNESMDIANKHRNTSAIEALLHHSIRTHSRASMESNNTLYGSISNNSNSGSLNTSIGRRSSTSLTPRRLSFSNPYIHQYRACSPSPSPPPDQYLMMNDRKVNDPSPDPPTEYLEIAEHRRLSKRSETPRLSLIYRNCASIQKLVETKERENMTQLNINPSPLNSCMQPIAEVSAASIIDNLSNMMNTFNNNNECNEEMINGTMSRMSNDLAVVDDDDSKNVSIDDKIIDDDNIIIINDDEYPDIPLDMNMNMNDDVINDELEIESSMVITNKQKKSKKKKVKKKMKKKKKPKKKPKKKTKKKKRTNAKKSSKEEYSESEEMKPRKKKRKRKAMDSESDDDGQPLKKRTRLSQLLIKPTSESNANVRRSSRVRFKPLNWWANERLVSDPLQTLTMDDIQHAIEDNNSHGILEGQESRLLNDKKPKTTKKATKSKQKKKKKKSIACEMKRKKKRKKSKIESSVSADEDIDMDEIESESDVPFIGEAWIFNSVTNEMELRTIAQKASELRMEHFNGDAVRGAKGLVSSEFSTGMIEIPPMATKKDECSYFTEVYHVLDAEKHKLKLVVSANEFMLGKHDMFCVPFDNQYSIENMSDNKTAVLGFTLIQHNNNGSVISNSVNSRVNSVNNNTIGNKSRMSFMSQE